MLLVNKPPGVTSHDVVQVVRRKLGLRRVGHTGTLDPFASGLGGPVPLSSVGGRAEFLTFSLDGSMSLNPASWLGAFRSGRAWTTLRPRKVDGGDGTRR